MLNYAFFYPIYIYSLFKSDLRLLSYELNYFSMAYGQNYTNNILNIFKHAWKLDIMKLDKILSNFHI